MKLSHIINNKSFCTLPWVNISTHTNGDVRLCCVSDAFVKKENGTNYNLGKDNISDIFNSKHMNQIRQDMLNGNPIMGCQKCYEIDKAGGKSNRTWNNVSWIKKPNTLKKVSQTINNMNVDETIEYFDIRFGNLCNLACRSCYPAASSQINKEVISLSETTAINKFHIPVSTDLNDWYQTSMFDQNIGSQMNNIRLYYMNGGEPTIIENNLSILKRMISEGVSKNVTITLNTNMTNTKKDFFDLLPNFHGVRMGLSIDGYGSLQEYIRYPSKWSQVDDNLKKLISLKLTNALLRPNPVISKMNLGYIVDLFDYIETMNLNYDAKLELAPIYLQDPIYLDLKYLPLDYKISCWEKIERWMDTCKTQPETFFHAMEAIKYKCFEKLDFRYSQTKFYEFNDILDQNRDQKLKDVNPELDSFRTKY